MLNSLSFAQILMQTILVSKVKFFWQIFIILMLTKQYVLVFFNVLVNRTGVAGAVLQAASSLIDDSFTDPLRNCLHDQVS